MISTGLVPGLRFNSVRKCVKVEIYYINLDTTSSKPEVSVKWLLKGCLNANGDSGSAVNRCWL